MSKIVELNLDEIAAVSGGYKTVTASVSASVAQPTLSMNATNNTLPNVDLGTIRKGKR